MVAIARILAIVKSVTRPEPGFAPDALEQFWRDFTAAQRRQLLEAIRQQLAQGIPAEATRNKFRLRRTSLYADYELRVDDMRVFYRIDAEARVVITVLGIKDRNRLLVGGKEFKL